MQDRSVVFLSGFMLLNALGLMFVAKQVREMDDTVRWVTIPRAASTAAVIATGDEAALRSSRLPRIDLFWDFTCPACLDSGPAVAGLREEFQDRVAVEIRHAVRDPRVAPASHLLAKRFSCLADFEEEQYFLANPRTTYVDMGVVSGNPANRGHQAEQAFERCMASGRAEEVIWRDRFAAAALRIGATPAIVYQGRVVFEGAVPEDMLRELLTAAADLGPPGIATTAQSRQ